MSSPVAAGFTFFWDGPLSQWHPSPMTVAGRRYLCAEHYMMHAKALLFGDAETAALILDEPEPVRQKSLGRRVRGFAEPVWEGARHAIVVTGSLAKYSQNPDLLAILLATGNTRLVQASPIDRVWGIGLAADDPRAADPAQWRGLNLLGDILTEVRDALRAVR
ncbi:NADAR family protein [Azospirillum rugosum]|uniref:RibA/ribD-fused uncharacterized protein n=1 Tax=Azospirillum rugosum TaxID=416170 RepID=A0ABS4ST82_9PROT|nr:NADAR family protein [Azospirillum rugosum]MBP2295647.1 ribA/ribD-fused uncharacterized protein [Azospirillum rugosum]MDQ0529463.1 ribA/ribD-fused uncharacterized protein [Azospirillum rugosum]